MSKRKLTIVLFLCISTLSLGYVPAHAQSGLLNIILLDCSGSTADTDPQRLAISSVKMTIDLLSPSSVGFIPFCGDELASGEGRLVDLISKRAREELKGEVDALQRQGNTPLAGAIKGVLRMLTEANAPPGSSLWVFSDGAAYPNTKGQETEIRELLPTFSDRGWRIHTVAFAKSKARFVEFLKEISEATGGVPYQARHMAEVQGYFLDIYAQVTGKSLFHLLDEELTGVGGLERSFPVDSSSTELTVVVFKESQATRIELLDPGDRPVSQSRKNVLMLAEDDHYKLIRLTGPAAGKWRLAATGEGRLIVDYFLDSDLELFLKEPEPRLVALGKTARLVAYFTIRGKRGLMDPTNRASIKAEVTAPDGSIITCEMKDDGEGGDEFSSDGLFSCLIHETEQPGLYRIRLELETTGAHISREESFIVQHFPSLRIKEPRGPIEVIQGEPIELKGEVLLEGKPFDPHGMEIAGELYPKEDSPVAAEVTLEANRIRWRVKPPGSGHFFFEAALRGQYQGKAFEDREKIPLEVKFSELTWHLPAAWKGEFTIRRGEPIEVPLTLMARERKVDIGGAKLVAELRGDGKPLPKALEGPRVDGSLVVCTIHPRSPGRYTLSVMAASPDGIAPLTEQKEIVLDVSIKPLTLQDMLPWLLLSGFILIGAPTATAMRNSRRCPRPRGFLRANGEVCNLSWFKDKITRLSRWAGRPILRARGLDLPGMEGIELRVLPEGMLDVRLMGEGDAALNGAPLGREWRPLRDGDMLSVGGYAYTYLISEPEVAATKELGSLESSLESGWDEGLLAGIDLAGDLEEAGWEEGREFEPFDWKDLEI